MNRFRTLNGCAAYKRKQQGIDFAMLSHRPDTPQEQLLNIVYADGKGDISLYLNQTTPLEIKNALEKLLQPIATASKYPDDVIAFDMLPHENETRASYGARLQQIINDAYKADVSAAHSE